MRRTFLVIVLTLAASSLARAADGDEVLVKRCNGELEEKLFAAGAHGESFITAKDVQRQADRVAVRLEIASGEGRRVTGTCIFKDGKLFDVR